jgi:hypothetical protein
MLSVLLNLSRYDAEDTVAPDRLTDEPALLLQGEVGGSSLQGAVGEGEEKGLHAQACFGREGCTRSSLFGRDLSRRKCT